jgi:hypothetical protein
MITGAQSEMGMQEERKVVSASQQGSKGRDRNHKKKKEERQQKLFCHNTKVTPTVLQESQYWDATSRL